MIVERGLVFENTLNLIDFSKFVKKYDLNF